MYLPKVLHLFCVEAQWGRAHAVVVTRHLAAVLEVERGQQNLEHLLVPHHTIHDLVVTQLALVDECGEGRGGVGGEWRTCCKNKPSPSLSMLALAINLSKRVTNFHCTGTRSPANSSMCASTVVMDGLKLLKASLHRPTRCSTWSAEPVEVLADCFVLTRDAPCEDMLGTAPVMA
jgi:hypothetical protein